MMSENMHYCYNVKYFQDALLKGNSKDESDCYAQHNRTIHDFIFHDESYLREIVNEEQLSERLQSFFLKTIYPGLFIGSGYLHEGKVPRETNEVKNVIIGGFYFDYVTGIPVIPGSSLKGTLRSYFKEGEKWEMIRELAEGLGVDFAAADMNDLVRNLFEQRDVFVGGFPIVGNNGAKLLDSEYITPHKEPFKDPIPLSLLKVRSGVKFQFVFLLYDYVSENGETILNAKQKSELYKELLLIGGIGAKTNVGFGQFTE